MEEFKSHTISFKVDKIPHAFTVYHNLPNVFGLSIEAAVMNWIHRTRTFTAENFCAYIRSKNTGHVCLTEEEYSSVIKKS